MRSPRFLFLTLLTFVSLLIFAASARAASPSEPCAARIGESDDAFIVTLQPGCDLRVAVRMFPQLDPESKRALPEYEQLRSVWAASEERFSSGKAKIRAVGRACVPAPKAPDWASTEEKEICPRGVVNYFGVASSGGHVPIYIPRTRTATHAERLESVARSACSALAAAPQGAAPAARSALDACRALTGAAEPAAAPAQQASEDRSTAVNDLTRKIDDKQRRIDELEKLMASRWSASTQTRTPLWMLLLFGAVLIPGSFAWFRAWKQARARRSAPAPQGGFLLDKDALERARAEIDRAFKRKLAQERERVEHELAFQRALVEELQSRLQAAQDAEAPASRPSRKGLRAEQELKSEIARLQELLEAETRQRQEQAADYQKELMAASALHDLQLDGLRSQNADALAALRAELDLLSRARQQSERDSQRLRQDLVKQQKRVVSLRSRLSAARQRFRPDTAETASIAGAGGLHASHVPCPVAGAPA